MASIYKSICYIAFICIVFLVGCSEALEYDDEEVVAIVRGEEITIRELRFLYPDDRVLNNIEDAVQTELMVQEAKRMNLDVTKKIEETVQAMEGYPLEGVDTPAAESIRTFAEPQAKKLGMEPKEYYEAYIEKTTETNAYVNQYLYEMLGEPDPELGIDEHNEMVHHYLEQLIELNADDIQIFINP